MSDTSSLDGIFKRNYDEGSEILVAQQNLATYVWGKISTSSMLPTPQGIFMPVTMSGNESGGAFNENEGFNVPQSLNPIQVQIQAKNINWPFEVTGRSIELSKTNKQAFVISLEAQMKDNMNRMFSDINRQACGTGTGQMALVTVAALAGATTLFVDNPIVFRRDMIIDVWTAVGGIKQTTVRITAVNYSAKSISVTPLSANVALNSVIVKKGILDGAPVEGKELSGLQRIADTTTFGTTFEGVSVTTNPEWQGNVVDGLTAPVSQDLLQKTHNRNAIIGGTKADFLISNFGQARTFLNTELQKTRYEPEKVLAGHTVLKWNSMEWLLDKDYPLNEVGMYTMKYIEKFQTGDVHLAKHTGNSYYQIINFDKIGGYYIYYGNMGSYKRNAHARLINLSEPIF